jgi:hypothetical protein
MKLVRHGETIVVIFERGHEKAYVMAQQGQRREWIPLYGIDEESSAEPVAEMHATSRIVRLYGPHMIQTELAVVFHPLI